MISGEPGIGKSALLDVARDHARTGGLRVLHMSGVTAEAHLPFAALQQAMGPVLKQADTLPPRQRSALLAAFGLSDDATAPDIFLVGLATLTLLTESAARKPILLSRTTSNGWTSPVMTCLHLFHDGSVPIRSFS